MYGNKVILILISIFNFLCLGTNTLAEQMPLGGIAIQEKHGIPILYAAIYGQSANIQQGKTFVFDPLQPIRMESRFIVSKYSKRQNHQLWMELAIINSPKEKLTNASKELAAFSQLMRFEMRSGDQLIFEYTPELGTKVILDGIVIKLFKGKNLQPILNSIWFGKRSPSKAFTHQLSLQPSTKSLRAFNKIKYPQARQEEIRTRFATENINEVKTKRSAFKNTKLRTKTSTKVKKTVPNTTNRKVVKSKNRNKVQPKVASRSNFDLALEKKVKDIKGKESEAEVAGVKEPTELDNIISSLEQEYKEELKEYIETKARPTPPRKIRRVPKYKATVMLELSSKGNKLSFTTIKITSGEFTRALEQSIINSIRQLRRLPSFPQSIGDKKLNIDVEIGFTNCKRSTSAWICL